MKGVPEMPVTAQQAAAVMAVQGKTSHNRIEITEWRVLFDDEDSLDMHVFGAGDTTSQLDLIGWANELEYEGGIVWNDDDAKNCGITINEVVIHDGQVLTSHDGRKFQVSITEVTAI